MEIKIDGVKEEDIITIKALTMSQRILDQVEEVRSEGPDRVAPGRLSRWLGYVNEAKADHFQITWLLSFRDSHTLVKMRETDFFWMVRARAENHKLTAEELRKVTAEEIAKLPQIFVK